MGCFSSADESAHYGFSVCMLLEQYRAQAVAQTQLLIEGRQDELIGRLRVEMVDAAAEERFERAASLRDELKTLRDRLMAIGGEG